MVRLTTLFAFALLLPHLAVADPPPPLQAVVWRDGAREASLRLTGRVMADYRAFDPEGEADTFTFRRVRFGFDARALGWLRLRVELDATSKAELADGFADLALHPAVILRAGQFKLPFSLDELTSSLFFDLNERSMLTAIAPNRDRGVELLATPLSWLTCEIALANGAGVDPETVGIRTCRQPAHRAVEPALKPPPAAIRTVARKQGCDFDPDSDPDPDLVANPSLQPRAGR